MAPLVREASFPYICLQAKGRAVSDNGLRKLAFALLVMLIFYAVAQAGGASGLVQTQAGAG